MRACFSAGPHQEKAPPRGASFDTLCVPCPELVEGSGRTEINYAKRTNVRGNISAGRPLHASRGRGTGFAGPQAQRPPRGASFDTLCVPCPELVEGSGRTETGYAKRTNVGACSSAFLVPAGGRAKQAIQIAFGPGGGGGIHVGRKTHHPVAQRIDEVEVTWQRCALLRLQPWGKGI